MADPTIRRPSRGEDHQARFAQPCRLRMLNAFEIVRAELLAAMKNFDVVVERAIAPCHIGPLRLSQNPGRKSMEKIQASIVRTLGMNLVRNRFQPAFGEE